MTGVSLGISLDYASRHLPNTQIAGQYAPHPEVQVKKEKHRDDP
jgi:hypothetical protein